MKNRIKLYYFAYLSLDNSFLRLTLNADENDFDYHVVDADEPIPNSHIWKSCKSRVVQKANINRLHGECIYEIFCTENDPLLFLRPLYLVYKNIEGEAKALLMEAEFHMKSIANEALNQTCLNEMLDYIGDASEYNDSEDYYFDYDRETTYFANTIKAEIKRLEEIKV